MKTKLLLIYSRFPYPLDCGDNVSRSHILKILSKTYEVHLVVINDRKTTQEQIDFVTPYCTSLEIFSYPKYRYFLNAAKFLFNQLPLQVNYFYFKEVKNRIDKLIVEKNIDVCLSYMMRTVRYADNISVPAYLDAQDSYYFRAKDSIKNTTSMFWKIVNRIEAKRFFGFEKKYVSKLPCVSYVNKNEALFWSKYGNAINIPFGAKDNLFTYTQKDSSYNNCIVFLGKMSYQPNVDAINWFAKNVLEYIDKDLRVLIIGAEPTNEILELQKLNRNIEVMGFVDDPYLIINSSVCLFAPMQTGSGVQNKIMEAMALGQVVVSTSISAYSIVGAQDRENILIEDEPEKFAELINDLYLGKIDTDKLKVNAKEIIRQNYSWETSGMMIKEQITKLLTK